MTDQITVPRATWDLVVGALKQTKSDLRAYGFTLYNWHKVVSDALTAANAVSHAKPETTPAPEGGAITSESDNADMLTIAYMDGFDAGKKSVQPQAQGEADPDDSLLICASDLEHSAIYDNHREMQSCIRSVAQRIKSLAAHPQATEPQEAISWEATTPGYIKYVTDRQYRSYSETAKRWYKPYKCSSCTAPKQAEPDPQLCSFYNVSTFPELVAEMEHHIRKLQDKLPVRDVLDFQKARQG